MSTSTLTLSKQSTRLAEQSNNTVSQALLETYFSDHVRDWLDLSDEQIFDWIMDHSEPVTFATGKSSISDVEVLNSIKMDFYEYLKSSVDDGSIIAQHRFKTLIQKLLKVKFQLFLKLEDTDFIDDSTTYRGHGGQFDDDHTEYSDQFNALTELSLKLNTLD